MNIQVRGTNTANKGAQLMLEAIVEEFSDSYVLSAPTQNSDYAVRSRLGLRQALQEYRIPRVSAPLSNLMPAQVKARYGLTSDREIDGVVDASGFAYGDAFNLKAIRREAILGERWFRREVPKVLLPQAFGPFNDAEKARWTKQVLMQANLIFVRDDISATYIDSLGLKLPLVKAPDFTIGLSPAAIPPIHSSEFMAIVPNSKMVTRGGLSQKDYLTELRSFVDAGRILGLDAVVVVHEVGDLDLAEKLASQTGGKLFMNDAPRKLKGALVQADIVVASRYHALVGSLSAGIPTIAFGWSHKYLELLSDFGVQHWLISVGEDPMAMMKNVLDDSESILKLSESKKELLSKTAEMWQLTRKVLERR